MSDEFNMKEIDDQLDFEVTGGAVAAAACSYTLGLVIAFIEEHPEFFGDPILKDVMRNMQIALGTISQEDKRLAADVIQATLIGNGELDLGIDDIV